MNCSFNIRYKPRTTRAFTKTDLTVYDSADNTALNALTVYGKSEVVDGAIVSAGDSGNIEVQTYTGTNQFGGLDFAQKLYEASITSAIDTTNKTVTFNRSKTEGDVILYNNFKANTQYTLILSYINDSRNTSLRIRYTDNTTGEIVLEPVSQKTIYRIVTDTNKSVRSFVLAYYGAGLTTLYYDECGIFEGAKTESDFEPYTGTMAVFSTGTPLRGIPDSNVRDVMAWDGSAGTVTKKCNKVRLADLAWQWWNEHPNIIYAEVVDKQVGLCDMMCSAYPYRQDISFGFSSESTYPDKTIYCAINISSIFIKNTDYSTKEDFEASLGDAELVYELATPTTQPLTSTENASIAGLKTFAPTTHAQNNAQIEMTVDYTIRVPTI